MPETSTPDAKHKRQRKDFSFRFRLSLGDLEWIESASELLDIPASQFLRDVSVQRAKEINSVATTMEKLGRT